MPGRARHDEERAFVPSCVPNSSSGLLRFARNDRSGAMTHQFNPTILREYDIRGIVGDTLTEADAYALGRTYAALARDEGAGRIAVGRDGRTHSGMLEAALVRGLTEGGIDVVLTGMGPSPM